MAARRIQNVLAALASGPVLAALILLLPLGVLTGVTVALNPSLAIDELAPEEELLIPFVLIAALISTANARLAWIMSPDTKSGRIFKVTTTRYSTDPSREEHPHGHSGRRLGLDFIQFLTRRYGGSVAMSAPEAEDYGWKFWIQREGFSPLCVAVAHVSAPTEDNPTEEYDIAVTLEPPLLPWRSLAYRPDFGLRDEIEQRLSEFLDANGLPFTADLEPWVDPEPKTSPGPRF